MSIFKQFSDFFGGGGGAGPSILLQTMEHSSVESKTK